MQEPTNVTHIVKFFSFLPPPPTSRTWCVGLFFWYAFLHLCMCVSIQMMASHKKGNDNTIVVGVLIFLYIGVCVCVCVLFFNEVFLFHREATDASLEIFLKGNYFDHFFLNIYSVTHVVK